VAPAVANSDDPVFMGPGHGLCPFRDDTEILMSDAHPPLRSYGRIKTRTIKPRQAALMETLLPNLRPPVGPFDPRTLIPGAAEAWLEIGFGGGEHMAAQALRHPDVLVIGAEPFQNGVASALRHIDDAALKNVRVLDGDVRELLARMPDASLARAFILFPDPWPKARHHKRRLVQAETVAELVRLLRPGAALRFASDWADYVDWSLELFLANPAFRWTAEQAGDWRNPPADHITTRYEEKRLGDCAPVFLDLVRI
jgi:tRNA (guanine-N7-)-methyltransferase